MCALQCGPAKGILVVLLGVLAFTATVAGTGIDRTVNAATFTAILGVLILAACNARSSEDQTGAADQTRGKYATIRT